MSARIIGIDPSAVAAEAVHSIAEVLRSGGVIVYPTDTFYGLGGDCFSRPALSRIYEIKGRPLSKALPVLISEVNMVERFASEVPAVFESLAAAFWPGPLTLILRAAPNLPEELVGPKRTIGIRLPDLSWLREMVSAAGFPVVATSANLSGRREIDSGGEAIRHFKDKVDMIIDGGKTAGGRPSTVVDLTSSVPVLRREGAIPRVKLLEVIDLS